MESVQSYLAEWVYGVEDRAAYCEKLGIDVHDKLKVGSRPSAVVEYGDY